MKLKLLAAAAMTVPMLLAGCVTSETKPIPKIAAKQATVHIPEAELLDVGIRVFDPGIPKNIENDEEALAKKRIYPDLRKAEARYMPTLLRATLEETAQWGAVRVIPATADFVDVIVTGKVVDSNGGFMAIDITAVDAAGRVWMKDKRYSSLVDLGAYKTTAALKARDPFQNVYSEIANDMVVMRDKLSALDRENIRKVASLKFAEDLAPDAMQGMTAVDKSGITQVVRLPADSDPTLARIERIRERDTAVVDTVNDYYASFAESMDDSTTLAPDQLHRTRKMRARSGANAHRARRRGAARRHIRAQLVQLLRRLPHQRRHAYRRHHGRHCRRDVGHQEIRRRARARRCAEGAHAELPGRGRASSRGSRGPHAAPDRHGGRSIPRMAQTAQQLYLETGAAAASTRTRLCSCLSTTAAPAASSVQLIRDKPESGRHQAVRPRVIEKLGRRYGEWRP
jgi:hypothetical protein